MQHQGHPVFNFYPPPEPSPSLDQTPYSQKKSSNSRYLEVKSSGQSMTTAVSKDQQMLVVHPIVDHRSQQLASSHSSSSTYFSPHQYRFKDTSHTSPSPTTKATNTIKQQRANNSKDMEFSPPFISTGDHDFSWQALRDQLSSKLSNKKGKDSGSKKKLKYQLLKTGVHPDKVLRSHKSSHELKKESPEIMIHSGETVRIEVDRQTDVQPVFQHHSPSRNEYLGKRNPTQFISERQSLEEIKGSSEDSLSQLSPSEHQVLTTQPQLLYPSVEQTRPVSQTYIVTQGNLKEEPLPHYYTPLNFVEAKNSALHSIRSVGPPSLNRNYPNTPTPFIAVPINSYTNNIHQTYQQNFISKTPTAPAGSRLLFYEKMPSQGQNSVTQFSCRTQTPLDYSSSSIGQTSSMAYNSNKSGASLSGTSSIHLPQRKSPFSTRRHYFHVDLKGANKVQQNIKDKAGKLLMQRVNYDSIPPPSRQYYQPVENEAVSGGVYKEEKKNSGKLRPRHQAFADIVRAKQSPHFQTRQGFSNENTKTDDENEPQVEEHKDTFNSQRPVSQSTLFERVMTQNSLEREEATPRLPQQAQSSLSQQNSANDVDDSSTTPALSNPPSVATLSSGLVRPVSQVKLISDINRGMASNAASLLLASNEAVKVAVSNDHFKLSRNSFELKSNTSPVQRKRFTHRNVPQTVECHSKMQNSPRGRKIQPFSSSLLKMNTAPIEEVDAPQQLGDSSLSLQNEEGSKNEPKQTPLIIQNLEEVKQGGQEKVHLITEPSTYRNGSRNSSIDKEDSKDNASQMRFSLKTLVKNSSPEEGSTKRKLEEEIAKEREIAIPKTSKTTGGQRGSNQGSSDEYTAKVIKEVIKMLENYDDESVSLKRRCSFNAQAHQPSNSYFQVPPPSCQSFSKQSRGSFSQKNLGNLTESSKQRGAEQGSRLSGGLGNPLQIQSLILSRSGSNGAIEEQCPELYAYKSNQGSFKVGKRHQGLDYTHLSQNKKTALPTSSAFVPVKRQGMKKYNYSRNNLKGDFEFYSSQSHKTQYDKSAVPTSKTSRPKPFHLFQTGGAIPSHLVTSYTIRGNINKIKNEMTKRKNSQMTRDQFLKKFEAGRPNRSDFIQEKFSIRNEKISAKPSVFHSNMNTPKVKDVSRFSGFDESNRGERSIQNPPPKRTKDTAASRKVQSLAPNFTTQRKSHTAEESSYFSKQLPGPRDYFHNFSNTFSSKGPSGYSTSQAVRMKESRNHFDGKLSPMSCTSPPEGTATFAKNEQRQTSLFSEKDEDPTARLGCCNGCFEGVQEPKLEQSLLVDGRRSQVKTEKTSQKMPALSPQVRNQDRSELMNTPMSRVKIEKKKGGIYEINSEEYLKCADDINNLSHSRNRLSESQDPRERICNTHAVLLNESSILSGYGVGPSEGVASTLAGGDGNPRGLSVSVNNRKQDRKVYQLGKKNAAYRKMFIEANESREEDVPQMAQNVRVAQFKKKSSKPVSTKYKAPLSYRHSKRVSRNMDLRQSKTSGSQSKCGIQ